MPAFPRGSQTTTAIRGSVFSALAHRLASHQGEVYPLHVGDTWLEPVSGARMEDLRVAERPGLHRYSEPGGRGELIEELAARLRHRTGLEVESEQLYVTAGATGGLFATMVALLEPGDEVLILAPHWPLIEGMVHACRGVPVAVPTMGLGSLEELLAALDERRSKRTVALYFSTPNNPTGRVLPRPWVESLVTWGENRDLWLIADEVYEDYVYIGEHAPAFPLSPERTVVAYSFSKAYGMAGNRCGYLLGPPALMVEVRKVGAHTFYSAPTAGQLAAHAALQSGDAWLAETCRSYRQIGTEVAGILDLDPPQGGTFLFFDLAAWLDGRGLFGLLEDCADRGLFLAPGPSFGPYQTYARLCFTAVNPEVTRRGALLLRKILDQRASAAVKESR